VEDDSVKWREAFDNRSGTAVPVSELGSLGARSDFAAALRVFRRMEAESRALPDSYDLAAALRIVRRMETSATRAAVFDEIKTKNRLVRLADAIYARAGVLQPLALAAYMAKSALSFRPFAAGAEAVAVAAFENERHAVERLAALVPDVRIDCLSPRRGNMLAAGQIGTALHLVGAIRRSWPYLRRLARRHGFMPAARIASALACYIRFSSEFAARPALQAAIVASNYSPEALGLSAAAHRYGRRVIYANHAPVPANGALVPPVLADLAVFYGDAIHRTYERHSRCSAQVALIGQPGAAQPMAWRDTPRTIGIFLTALTRGEAVEKLVDAIAASQPDLRIIIRNHPVALLKSSFAELSARHRNLTVTIGKPLDDEIAACDLVFCGNSGVALNVLRGGRPVAYLAALDALRFDYNGFVESNLVCAVPGWSEMLYRRLRAFYENPDWRGVMRGCDASYGMDPAKLEAVAARTIRRFLAPRQDRG
jgi:hypothetical protein